MMKQTMKYTLNYQSTKKATPVLPVPLAFGLQETLFLTVRNSNTLDYHSRHADAIVHHLSPFL
jgi:hypothetical protein